MKAAPPIACDLHDHLEVACLYRYEMEVSCTDGSSITGTAANTRTALGNEFLILEVGSERREIPMYEIAAILVLTPNAKFTKLTFERDA